MRRGEGLERVEKEILQEKAATLGRAGERLEAALAGARAAAEALDAEPDPARRGPLLREYQAARRRAESARLMLVIQREAIGLRHHRDVDRQFPAPPPRA